MGRLLLVARLAARDLRRRPAEAALLLVAITAATATLTLGLVLHGVTDKPYQSTREATAGPDVVVSVAPPPYGGQSADLAALRTLVDDPEVVGHSGPYPYSQASLKVHGVTATAWVQGRTADAPVDRPKLTEGSWAGDGGAVLEASFADALAIRAGDSISLDGRSFRVDGIAVSAATGPYPKVCYAPCWFGAAAEAAERAEKASGEGPPRSQTPPPASAFRPDPSSGLVWLTEADVRSLVQGPGSLAYVLNLKLSDPAAAPAFVNAHLRQQTDAFRALVTWRDILAGHDKVFENKQDILLVGSWLLSLLALATIAVLVGGRMADQIRRVGLLKAVGGTPSLVAAVLLVEYLAVALVAAAAGLAVGRLTAPLLTDPGAGLVGSAGAVPFDLSTVALVTAAALAVAITATSVPAVRAARTSTVLALGDSARPPRRSAWLIALSARLPVPLLLGLRIGARRPRRTLLGAASIAITVSGIVAALAAYAHFNTERAPGSDPRGELSRVLVVITIMLVAQAAVNAICITWATALDARRSSALARALGATPDQVSAGLSAAQVLPALAGAILGVPGGIALAAVLDDDPVTIPPLWQLVAVVLGSALVIAALTAIPARFGARRPAAEILQAELA